MIGKKWAVSFVSMVSLCLLASCGGSGGSSPTANVPLTKDSYAVSTLARNTAPAVVATDYSTAVAGTTTFALRAFPLLDSNLNHNTFFSPYGITGNFLLLAPGANGMTFTGIQQALSFSQSPDLLYPAFDKLDLLIASETSGTTLTNGLHTPSLVTANAIWTQNTTKVLSAYLDTLAVNFGEGIHQLNFAASNASTIINDWVAQNTNNLVQGLIPASSVSAATRMVLTNATLFEADLASPFNPSNTANKTFYNRNGSTASVPQMQTVFSSLPYTGTSGYKAVELPYAGGLLSLVVIEPAAGTFDTFANNFTPAVLSSITSGLSATTVDLTLPKFSFSQSPAMKSILQSLGMSSAFASGQADFSKIDGVTDLYLGDIFHQAYVSVSEGGTVTAVATGTLPPSRTTSAPSAFPSGGGVSLTQTMVVDHPFIFLIRERSTGLILYLGKVVSLS
ncbi:serpin family protein [Geomonas sp. Red32]|uniref:serpin family protein n=1 Tax=Geomonas sp. Red32 TaxID=2912856 RepID=UPI00202CD7DF|nr:serpin family protein [Geomonas sp. Red32]MCM0080382.1 serpin family protein [Geomonas sp. Red32]